MSSSRPSSARSSRPGSASAVQAPSKIYSVPQSIVFRSFGASDGPFTRRLLIKNGAADPCTFRLTLPSKTAAFSIAGQCVNMATFDTISSVQLSAGGTAALTITLQRDELADMAEVVDELLIRTHEDTVHVPIAAVRDGRTPSTGEPVEKRSAPSRDEHWDEADDSREVVPGG